MMGSDNVLVPLVNTQLSEPIEAQIYVVIGRH